MKRAERRADSPGIQRLCVDRLRRAKVAACALVHLLASAYSVAAQEVRGRASDGSTGRSISFAEVALLDGDGVPVVAALSDSEGRFVLKAPSAGEYYVAMQRLGYEAMRSPLIAVEEDGAYLLELETAPEAIPLRGLEVSVVNEATVNWLRREFRGSPYAMKGFRLIRGVRLEEAKSKSRDNTQLLRWLYIPVSHGRQVCVLALFDACGELYVDGRWMPAEHVESIDMESIATIVTVLEDGARVYLFTSDFDWKKHWNP